MYIADTPTNFTINLAPVPGSRPRVTKWSTFYPKKHTQFQKDMEQYIIAHPELITIAEAINNKGIIEVEFHIPIPKSASKKEREIRANTPHKQRPDIDNYCKLLFDCLFKEDSSIYKVVASKYWTNTEGYIMLILK